MLTFYYRKYMVVVGILVILPVFSLFAQQRLTLKQLIDAAQSYLPVLKQKQAFIDESKVALSEVKHSFLPQVKLSEQLNVGSNNSLAGTFFSFGITPSTSAGVRASNTNDLVSGNIGVIYSEYELANFGLNKAKLGSAKANIDLQEANLKKEMYLLQLTIARLYFSVVKYQYRLNADKQNTNRYEIIFFIIQALTKSGLKPGADSSLAKAELSKARINYNQTLGKIMDLKQQLSYLTGMDADRLTLDTTQLKWKDRDTISVTAKVSEIDHPLLDYYFKKNQLLNANEYLIKKSYLPKIVVASALWARGSSIQYNDNFKPLSVGLGYQRFNYAIGVAFTYNLLNGIYKKDRLLLNNYQKKAGEYELLQQKLALGSASLQANNALAITKENLLELPVQLSSAQAVFSQKTAQYRAGLISLVDVTNASFVLYRSQTDYIETINDWYLAQLEKAASLGTLSQFIQTIK
ncbi:MAG: TolC family protein [Chitinophagaceae bacterium]|nr:TolC family protein [Chitinophagaceae bacterium]